MRRVKIKKAPGTGFARVDQGMKNIQEPEVSINSTLKPVERSKANLEAEKGETVVTDINQDGLPEYFKIGGKSHAQGGTPLNLPSNSFIFSRDKSLRIKDEEILKQFGKSPKKSGYTPAELSTKYDINKYRKVLADPDSDEIERRTAEMMIANYNLKLGKLALAQESLKGFPDGIPAIAMPYILTNNIDPSEFVGNSDQAEMQAQQTMRKGGAYYQDGGEVNLVDYLNYVSMPESEKRSIKRQQSTEIPYFAPEQTTPVEKQTPTTGATTYTKSGLPDNAVVKDASATDLKVGEYIKTPEGKYKKVVGFTSQLTGSKSGPEGYMQFYGTKIEDDVKQANVILARLAKQRDSGVTYNTRTGKYDITGASKKNLSLEDQELLTKVSSYNEATPEGKTLGASKYGFKVGTQNTQGTKLGFVGWVTPELVEYQYWAANNPGKTTKDYKALPDDQKVANRKDYLGYLGYDTSKPEVAEKLNNPEELYSPSFVGSFKDRREGTLVDRVQKTFPRDMFRPIHEDDYTFGTEHADFYRFNKTAKFEDVKDTPADMVWVCNNGTVSMVSKDQAGGAGYTSEAAAIAACKPGLQDTKAGPGSEWWMQDIVKTAGAFGDLHRIKKYTPWAAPYQPVLPDPTFYDPTRELAANAEQVNLGVQGAAMFAGPQAFNARFSQMQGQGARNAAEILARYNNLNVGVANQFGLQQAGMLSEANKINRDIAQDQYDKMTIANQQFDNAKAMARQNMRQSYIDALTNRANAQVLNSLYPQYNISPIQGGMMNFVKGRPLTPTFGNEQDVMQIASDYMQSNPGFDPAQYFAAAKMKMGMPQGQPYGYLPNQDFMNMYAGMTAGMGE